MSRQRLFVLWIVRWSLCVMVFVIGREKWLIVAEKNSAVTYGRDILIWPWQRYQYEKWIQPHDRLEGAFYEFADSEFISQVRHRSYDLPVSLQIERRQYDEMGESYDSLVEKTMMTPLDLHSDEWMGISYLHSKVWLVDNTAIIQSANISYQWLVTNTEMFLRSSESSIVESVAYMLAQDRARQPLDMRKIDERLLVCPITCRWSIERAIAWAKSSIRIANQYITDQALIALLEDKHRRGVAIEILAWSYQGMSVFSWTMIAYNVQVYTWPYLHMKSMLIDDYILLWWSINFSTNALDNNREVWLWVKEKETIRFFNHRFSSLYIQ